MKDFLNQELEIGDYVVSFNNERLTIGKIVDLCPYSDEECIIFNQFEGSILTGFHEETSPKQIIKIDKDKLALKILKD